MRAVLSIALSLLIGCGGDEPADCTPLVGSYQGTLSGNTPFNGSVTVVVAAREAGSANFTGTWTGESGHFGEINRADLDCATGSVNNEYGMALLGPSTVVCPSPCAPGSSGAGCYCNGATLGVIRGTLTSSGGSGSFTANSGAAQQLGVTGSGSWSVTRN